MAQQRLTSTRCNVPWMSSASNRFEGQVSYRTVRMLSGSLASNSKNFKPYIRLLSHGLERRRAPSEQEVTIFKLYYTCPDTCIKAHQRVIVQL